MPTNKSQKELVGKGFSFKTTLVLACPCLQINTVQNLISAIYNQVVCGVCGLSQCLFLHLFVERIFFDIE